MKLFGYVVLAIGFCDFLLSWFGFNLTGFLPDIISAETPAIFSAIGITLLYVGRKHDLVVPIGENENILYKYRSAFGMIAVTDSYIYYYLSDYVTPEFNGIENLVSRNVWTQIPIQEISSLEIQSYPTHITRTSRFYGGITLKLNDEQMIGIHNLMHIPSKSKSEKFITNLKSVLSSIEPSTDNTDVE